MNLLFASKGGPLACKAGARALMAALPAGATPPAGHYSGPYPGGIGGLSGWWDGGLLGGLRDVNAAPVLAVGSVVGSLVDKSNNNKTLMPYNGNAAATPAATLAVARVNGYLGAVGAPAATMAAYAPTLDAEWGLRHAGMEFGAGVAWTRYLVWTRPNLRQATLYNNASPIGLLHCTATGSNILQADSAGSNLTLFAGSAAPVVLTTTLTRRHTHAVIVRNTPGVGVDVWLDGVQVAAAVANPLGVSALGPVLFLHDNTPQGSAQCWFHEAASWEHALTAPDIATLLACQARWVLGPRQGVAVLVMGQSNAAWFAVSGGGLALAQGIAWYCGAAAYSMLEALSGTYNNPSRYSVIFGHPVSNSSPPLFAPGPGNGTFLTNPGDGSDPSTWPGGPDFQALSAYLTGAQNVVPVADDGDIAFLVWPWSEQDSTMPYANKALYKASVLRLLALTRNLLGRSAANLPLLVWNAIPYETNDGVQMVREAMADLAAVVANNIVLFASQTSDSNPLNASYNPATGVFSGGDPQHRDQPDLLRYGRMGAHAAGQAALAQGRGDSVGVGFLPATGLPRAGGPRIAHVYRASNTSLVVTIAHDAGNDVLLPLQAARGAGFAVMDGGSVAAPGPMILATSAVRVDATHIEVTLASAISSPSASAFLFYPYGSAQIGRGNAVTDNLALQPPPVDWDIGQDLGSDWLANMPLQATQYPITLADTPQ